MSEKAISPNITTKELMAMDYHYHYSNDELYADWLRLKNISEFKSGSQFKPGMKLCQHFFPNFWQIKNKNNVSFADCWKNEELMDKVLSWGKVGMSQLWMSWIRRAVFMSAGLPNSSFYRPHFSRQIIMNSKIAKGIMFDPCAGWGGRMLGAVSCGWKYIACEPNAETYENIQRLIDFLQIHQYVSIENIAAEDFAYSTIADRVDIILTSPPYFNLEVYSDDETQSYHRYNTYIDWVDCWLSPLIKNCAGVLKDNGLSCWNSMNFNDKMLMANDITDIHTTLGYKLSYTLGFQSPIANIRKIKNKDLTYIFSK